MKKNILILSLALLVILFTACEKKDHDHLPPPADEMLELIKRSAEMKTGGFIHLLENIARTASVSRLACATISDTTVRAGTESPSLVAYSYDVQIRRQLVCAGGMSARLDFPVQGMHTIKNMFTQDEGQVNMANVMEETGLTNGSWHLTTRYARSGTVSSALDDAHFDYTITFSADDLLIDKTTSEVSSGTAQIQVQYFYQRDPVEIYNGTLVFHGNRQALLRFDEVEHLLQW